MLAGQRKYGIFAETAEMSEEGICIKAGGRPGVDGYLQLKSSSLLPSEYSSKNDLINQFELEDSLELLHLITTPIKTTTIHPLNTKETQTQHQQWEENLSSSPAAQASSV